MYDSAAISHWRGVICGSSNVRDQRPRNSGRKPAVKRSAASSCWAAISMATKAHLCLLCRKPQGRKIGSHDRISGEPARFDRFAVIHLR